MTNWCSNALTLSAKSAQDIDRLLTFVHSEDSLLDFNNIVPMPPALNDTNPNTYAELGQAIIEGNTSQWLTRFRTRDITDAVGLCAYYGKTQEEVLAAGQQRIETIKLYGVADWHQWRCKNWGTRGHRRDVRIERNSPTEACLKFETAWDPPVPVIVRLAEMFPMVDVGLYFVEMGRGFEGHVTLVNGVMIEEVVGGMSWDVEDEPTGEELTHEPSSTEGSNDTEVPW